MTKMTMANIGRQVVRLRFIKQEAKVIVLRARAMSESTAPQNDEGVDGDVLHALELTRRED